MTSQAHSLVMMLRGRGVGRNEGKQVHWKNKVERTAVWVFLLLFSLKCGHFSPLVNFFFNWPYFQISLLWEEKSDRFSGELTSGRASTKPKSWKSHLNLHQCNITQRIPPDTVSGDLFWLQHRHGVLIDRSQAWADRPRGHTGPTQILKRNWSSLTYAV